MRAGDAGAVGKVMALVRESLGAGWRGAVVAGAALEHSIQALARCFSGAQRVLLRGRAGDWRGDDGSCRSCRSADARHAAHALSQLKHARSNLEHNTTGLQQLGE
eukprot:3936196-Rhodomonas_salina.2